MRINREFESWPPSCSTVSLERLRIWFPSLLSSFPHGVYILTELACFGWGICDALAVGLSSSGFCFAFAFAFDVWLKFQFLNAIVEVFWDCWSCFDFFFFWKDSFITQQDFHDALAEVSTRAQTQPVVNPNSKSDTKIHIVDDRGGSYSPSWAFKNLLNSKPWPPSQI